MLRNLRFNRLTCAKRDLPINVATTKARHSISHYYFFPFALPFSLLDFIPPSNPGLDGFLPPFLTNGFWLFLVIFFPDLPAFFESILA